MGNRNASAAPAPAPAEKPMQWAAPGHGVTQARGPTAYVAPVTLKFACQGLSPALEFCEVTTHWSSNEDEAREFEVLLCPSEAWVRKIVDCRREQGWWGVYPFDPEHVWPHTMWVGPWRYWSESVECIINISVMFLMQEEARAFTVRVFSHGEMECETIFGESVVLNGPRLLNQLGVGRPTLTILELADVNHRSAATERGRLRWRVNAPLVSYLVVSLKRVYYSQRDDGAEAADHPAVNKHQQQTEDVHQVNTAPVDRRDPAVIEFCIDDEIDMYQANPPQEWHGTVSCLPRGVYELALSLRAPSSVRPTVLSRRQFVIGERELVPDDVLDSVHTIPSLVQLSLDSLLNSGRPFSASGDGHSPQLLNPVWQRCIDHLPPEACVAGFRASNLTSVRVYCADFPATTMDFLASLPHLADLCLDGAYPSLLGDTSLIARLTGLRRLAVQGVCVGCDEVLAAAVQLPHLRSLELAALVSNVVDVRLRGRQHLAALAPRLHTLALVGFSNVQAVLLGTDPDDDADCTAIASAALLSLDISHARCGRHKSSPELLRRLRDAFPNLQQLNYSYNRLAPGQLAVFAELPALRHVNASHCHSKRLDGVDYAHCLAPLLAAPHLHTLVYYNKCHSPIDAIAVESAFAAAGKLAKATKLQWAYNPATRHYGVRRKSGKWPGTDIARIVPSPKGVEWSVSSYHVLSKPADPNDFFWMPVVQEPDDLEEFRFAPLSSFSSIAYCPTQLLIKNPRFHVCPSKSSNQSDQSSHQSDQSSYQSDQSSDQSLQSSDQSSTLPSSSS